MDEKKKPPREENDAIDQRLHRVLEALGMPDQVVDYLGSQLARRFGYRAADLAPLVERLKGLPIRHVDLSREVPSFGQAPDPGAHWRRQMDFKRPGEGAPTSPPLSDLGRRDELLSSMLRATQGPTETGQLPGTRKEKGRGSRSGPALAEPRPRKPAKHPGRKMNP